MKNIFIFLIPLTLLKSDYLATRYASPTCVYDLQEQFTRKGKSRGFCYFLSSDSSSECDRQSTISDFVDGYALINGNCVLVTSDNNTSLNEIGLTQSDTNYQFSLMGNVVGFVFLFNTLFLTILIGRK